MKFTLNKKVIIYLFFTSIIPILILGVLSFSISYNSIQKEVNENNNKLLDEKKKYLLLFINDIENIIDNISSIDAINQILLRDTKEDSVYRELAIQSQAFEILNSFSQSKGVVSLDIFSKSGVHFHVGETIIKKTLSYESIVELYEQNKNKKIIWKGIEKNENKHSPEKYLISFIKVLERYDNAGTSKPIGAILLKYSAYFFNKHFHTTNKDKGFFTIIDSNKRILSHPDNSLLGSKINSAICNFLENDQNDNIIVLNNEEMFVNHTHIQNKDWEIIYFSPVAYLKEKIRTILLNTFILLICILPLIVLALFFISKNIINPINNITNNFQLLEQGVIENDYKLKENTKDEIGELVLWFNKYIDSIMEKQKTEQELVFTRKLLNNVFDSLPSILISIDKDCKVTQWNRSAERFTGVHSTRAYSKEIWEVLPMLQIHREHIDNVMQTKSFDENLKSELVLNSEKKFFHTSIYPLSSTGASGAVIRLDDVTEIIKKDELLRQAQKMETVGNLAGGIAHDFNNLLTGIMGNVDLSLLELAPGSNLYDNMVEVRKAAQSAAGLTRQLLAYSRKQMINPVTFNLNSLIAALRDMVMRLIGENIRLETRLGPDLGSIRGDTSQMEQVIINLIVNARDAMPNGGTLAIKTSRIELDEEYCSMHPETTPGMYIALEITDTGTGIDPAVLPHIFEPFYTTKTKEKGTGLGLATTYGIVKQNNGHIAVNTETGKGSVFTVYLPEFEEQPDAIGSREQQGECRGGNETILVVEDEPFVKNVAVEILKNYGYRVLDASSGPDALQILAKYKDPIDLLLSDVVMPGMNGAELAKILSERFPAMKILFTSGYTNGIIDNENLLDERVNFIQKPYQADDLARKVRQVMDAGGACS